MAEEEEKRSKVGAHCELLCTAPLLWADWVHHQPAEPLGAAPKPANAQSDVSIVWTPKNGFFTSWPREVSSSSLWYFVCKGAPHPLTNNCFDKKVTDTKVGGKREINFYEKFYSELSPKKSSHNLKIFAVQAIGVESWEIFHESSGSSPSHYMGK